MAGLAVWLGELYAQRGFARRRWPSFERLRQRTGELRMILDSSRVECYGVAWFCRVFYLCVVLIFYVFTNLREVTLV
jgi:hypothetical protein